MDKIRLIQSEAFSSTEFGAKSTAPLHSRARRNSYARDAKARTEGYASSMLMKLGICAAACAFVLVLKCLPSGETDGPSAVQSVSATASQENAGEQLGKLQFVELPGVLSVFAGSDAFGLPVSYQVLRESEDGGLVSFTCMPGEQVCAVGDGVVFAIGTDAAYGDYVIMKHAGDVQSTCYGIAEIQVEQGQPLKKNDTLGVVGENGTVHLSVTVSGRPALPSELIGF